VAEFLGERGYATGGFAGNLAYCSSDSGLARGFGTYRDFIVPDFTALHFTAVGARVVDGIQGIESVCTYALGVSLLRRPADLVWRLFGKSRKEAAVINREFLDWLAARRGADRPFFTRDSYDDCVADLDERLGELIDELDRRAVLERTWVIITADHGESFGEHPGVFLHGATLCQTKKLDPLLVIPPGGAPSPKFVTDAVSLRDLAATIVDVSGAKGGSPFPGVSLARFWDASPGPVPSSAPSPALSELAPERPPGSRHPGTNFLLWPMASLIDGDWSYMRREGDLFELLFNLREDPGELRNLADEPAMRATVERMGKAIGPLTAGPLTPDRFNP
jgi:hypothetical protein